MRAFFTSMTRIEFVDSPADAAELAKFTQKFGADFRLSLQTPLGSQGDDCWVAEIRQDEANWLQEVLPKLVYLSAFTGNQSPDQVLEQISSRLSKHHGVDVSKAPQDQRGVGEGPNT